MTCRPGRCSSGGSLRRLLAVIALIVPLTVFALRVSATTGDSAGAGPQGWVDDLSPIAACDWTPRSRRPSPRARRLWRDAGGDRAPGRDDAERGRRLASSTTKPSTIATLKPFDESGIWDPGMDPFPPSRAEAVRIARERGEGLGEKVLPAGAPAPAAAGRRQVLLQPGRQRHRNAAARPVVGEPHARDQAAARGEADAVLARPLRDRREQGPRLPDDAPAERDVPRAAPSGSLRDLLVGILEGSGDARLSRQRREHQDAPQRELRPRAARAVHDGRRQLHRARRARSRARVHRLDQRRPGVQVRRRRSTTSARRRSSAGPDTFNGEDIIDIILAAAGHGRVRGREALPVLRARGDRRRR